ncbi:hypothetical protein [Nonomuraea sp. NPDC048901]|uniref:hypothetical protein n=1 Tax=Nonomuraea sp. NPDC048901 TaxID=3155627 RepID=UPI0033FD6D63
MFTRERRHQVRAQLIERARVDGRIIGAALTGSAARALLRELAKSLADARAEGPDVVNLPTGQRRTYPAVSRS